MPTNDNVPAIDGVGPLPDAHGHAALLLVESLMHGLCANATLTVEQAMEVAERAIDVQSEQAEAATAAGGVAAGAPMWRSHALLSAIAASLTIDGRDDPRPLRPVN